MCQRPGAGHCGLCAADLLPNEQVVVVSQHDNVGQREEPQAHIVRPVHGLDRQWQRAEVALRHDRRRKVLRHRPVAARHEREPVSGFRCQRAGARSPRAIIALRIRARITLPGRCSGLALLLGVCFVIRVVLWPDDAVPAHARAGVVPEHNDFLRVEQDAAGVARQRKAPHHATHRLAQHARKLRAGTVGEGGGGAGRAGLGIKGSRNARKGPPLIPVALSQAPSTACLEAVVGRASRKHARPTWGTHRRARKNRRRPGVASGRHQHDLGLGGDVGCGRKDVGEGVHAGRKRPSRARLRPKGCRLERPAENNEAGHVL